MGDVTISIPADRTDFIRRLCFYEFVRTDSMWQTAQKHYVSRFTDSHPNNDLEPLRAELLRISEAQRVLDQIGWVYGEAAKAEQITANREWLSDALEWENRSIMDTDSGDIQTTDDMRRSADAGDFVQGILDNIGWPEKQKPEEAVAA